MGKAINRFCIPFLFALLACTNETKQLNIALQQAKDNKEELIKVLKHFENDSLKYRFSVTGLPDGYKVNLSEVSIFFQDNGSFVIPLNAEDIAESSEQVVEDSNPVLLVVKPY